MIGAPIRPLPARVPVFVTITPVLLLRVPPMATMPLLMMVLPEWFRLPVTTSMPLPPKVETTLPAPETLLVKNWVLLALNLRDAPPGSERVESTIWPLLFIKSVLPPLRAAPSAALVWAEESASVAPLATDRPLMTDAG